MMNRSIKLYSSCRLSPLLVAIGLLLTAGLAQPLVADAAQIVVTNTTEIPHPGFCTLRQAFIAHNKKETPFFSNCKAGDGNDTILLDIDGNTIDVGGPLTVENGSLTIVPLLHKPFCYNLRQSTYLTVNNNASLTLSGISMVVNGAEFKSVIDNDGGNLTIEPNGLSGRCYFSNQHGRERKTTLGGVLHNRNNGTATINANFENSSAYDRGGAIYVDSGTVTINGGTFKHDNAAQGGAIYVNSGATLNIQSNDFSISDNTAPRAPQFTATVETSSSSATPIRRSH